MRHLALLFLVFAGMTLAAERPACFDGPVTKGTLTVTCSDVSMASTSQGRQAWASDLGRPLGRLLVVKAVSTDPSVVGVRIAVTHVENLPDGKVYVDSPRSGTVVLGVQDADAPGATTFTFTFEMPYVGDRGMPLLVSGITAEELTAKSKDSF